MPRFLSHCFTASGGSEESAAGRVASPCSIMMHHCSDLLRRGVQESKNIDYAKQHYTLHCWLPAKVMYAANSTKRFSWLTRSTSILLMKNVQIYILAFIYLYIYLPDTSNGIHIMDIQLSFLAYQCSLFFCVYNEFL